MYRFFSQVAGARIVSIRYDERMNFPLEPTLRELKRSPHILFIANSNNPTATLVDEADLARILDAAPRTLILVDEAYFEFSGLTVLPSIRQRPNLIVSRTFSKAMTCWTWQLRPLRWLRGLVGLSRMSLP